MPLDDRIAPCHLILMYKILQEKIDCPSLLSRFHFRVPQFDTNSQETFYIITDKADNVYNSSAKDMYRMMNDSCEAHTK